MSTPVPIAAVAYVVRHETNRWTFRFWFATDGASFEHRQDRVREWANAARPDDCDCLREMMRSVQQFFQPSDGLLTAELLVSVHGSGVSMHFTRYP